jgi:hypothetical protein
MMKKTIYALMPVFILISACEVISEVIKTEKTPVVQAFLMHQQDTLKVSVKYLIPYSGSEEDTVQLPVSQIPVYLIRETDTLLMEENRAIAGEYLLSSSELNLKPGDTIRLFGIFQDIPFRAQTRIPTAVESLAISSGSIYYKVGDPRSMMNSENLTISWDNTLLDFYYITVENTETDPEPLNEMMVDMPMMSFAYPSQADQFQVSMRNIRYFGRHRVIVFHVNPEFADIFDNSELTSNAITQPPGNVENAHGIFTAITADTVYFTVYKQ